MIIALFHTPSFLSYSPKYGATARTAQDIFSVISHFWAGSPISSCPFPTWERKRSGTAAGCAPSLGVHAQYKTCAAAVSGWASPARQLAPLTRLLGVLFLLSARLWRDSSAGFLADYGKEIGNALPAPPAPQSCVGGV